MAMDFQIVGASGTADVAGSNQLKVIAETDVTNHAANVGGMRQYAENDQGLATLAPYLVSPEADLDYRQRSATDLLLDDEHLSYNGQNFTKFRMDTTTFVPTFTAGGYTTQATTPLTTAAAASQLRTWKTFTIQGTETVSCDFEMSINLASGTALASPIVIECGLALSSTTTPFDAFDGVYLRFNSNGAYLVLRNSSGSDSATYGPVKNPDGLGTNTWAFTSGRTYQFIIYWHSRTLQLWIGDPVTNQVWLAGTINTPATLGTPTGSPSLNFWIRQYQTTAPAVGAYARLSRYSIRRGGMNVNTTASEQSQRAAESNLSPGSLSVTAGNTVTSGSVTRPTSAVPANTTALITGLSGIVLETITEALSTDVILMAYQNPAVAASAASAYPQARRLRIDAVRIGTGLLTTMTGGPLLKYFYLAYGSTSLSLAGVASDTVNTKAYRRVMLELVQAYTAAQASPTLPAIQGSTYMAFKNPIYVNPGEWVALVTYHVGTVATAGGLQHHISFDYGWE